MRHALTLGWARFDRVLLLVFVIGAVLARVILPFIIIPAIGAFFLSLVYTGGRSLLIRSVWRGSSPTLSLALELLLLLPLVRIPYVGGFFVILYLSLGLGLVISTHFGSNGPWNLTPLLEEDRT